MVEGAHTIAAIILETVVGTNGILVPPDGYLAGVRADLRRARHRAHRRRGHGRLRPLRRVVRRRPLGRDPGPDHLRQGRQLRLRAARRRDHLRRDRRDLRRIAPTPGGLTYSGPSAGLRVRRRLDQHLRGGGHRRARPHARRRRDRARTRARSPPGTRRSARSAGSASSGRSSWCATARRTSRSSRSTPPAPAAAPMNEFAAACKAARPVAVHALQPHPRRAAVHHDGRRDPRRAGDPRRGARGRRPLLRGLSRLRPRRRLPVLPPRRPAERGGRLGGRHLARSPRRHVRDDQPIDSGPLGVLAGLRAGQVQVRRRTARPARRSPRTAARRRRRPARPARRSRRCRPNRPASARPR